MTPTEKIEEMKTNAARIRTWKRRSKLLKEREIDPLSDKDFCERYNINQSWFCRTKKKTEQHIPRTKTVDEVEEAFENEGV